MFDPKPSLSDMVWEEGTYMTRTNVNQTTWIPIKNWLRYFKLTHLKGRQKGHWSQQKGGVGSHLSTERTTFQTVYTKGALHN